MLGLTQRLTGAMRRLRGQAAPAPAPTPPPVCDQQLELRVEHDLRALTHVEDIRACFAHAEIVGAIASFTVGAEFTEDVMRARLVGRTAGEEMPPWHDGSGGGPANAVTISRLRDALHTPDFGAVIDRRGLVMKASIGEALYVTPNLEALPHVTVTDEVATMAVPANLPRLDAAAVFMAWGGRFNYGHFLLDCLPSLAALKLAGLLDDRPPIAPPLTDWQREGVRLLLGDDPALRPTELSAPLVWIGDVAFANTMDHFLHGPNKPLDWVREQMLAHVDLPDTGLRRLYISRRGDDKRLMVNEAQLEAKLIARGFTIIQPQTLSVAHQIALFRDADVIVAPTGAALANTLFCKPDAKVFEIQPSNFVGIWVRGVCHFVGADWHGFFARSPLKEREIYIGGTIRPGTSFQWKTPLPAFLDFLDARIG